MQKNYSRLEEKYKKDVVKKLKEELGIKNSLAIPKITKIVINTGSSEIAKSKELMQAIKRDLATISGQQPAVQKAKVSIASFNLRRGMPVGLKVTLRGKRIYDFLDRLFSLALPRLRDFRGVRRNSFDSRGNYTLGIAEHVIFPEVDQSKVLKPFGLEITIVMNSVDIKGNRRLLELLGMPFAKEDQGLKGKPERSASGKT